MRIAQLLAASLLLLSLDARAGTAGHDDPKQDDERYDADDAKAPNPLPWKLPDGKTARVAVLLSFGHSGSTERAIVTLGDQVWEIANDEVDNDKTGGELKVNADGSVFVRVGQEDRLTVTWNKTTHSPVAKPVKKSH